jgi:hypothetical protein
VKAKAEINKKEEHIVISIQLMECEFNHVLQGEEDLHVRLQAFDSGTLHD